LVAAGLLSFCDGEFHSNQINKCMRPTKLLTISAIAGLSLISYGRSAHALPVNVTGSVSSSCTLAVSPGSLFEDTVPETVLVGNGGNSGTVVVTCNDSAKRLKLTINNAASVVNNGIGKIRFVGPALPASTNGVFAGIALPLSGPAIDPIIVAIANPTKSGGDTGLIQARIEAPPNKLLKAGSYNLVVDAEITP
jgi:hypothetical protein